MHGCRLPEAFRVNSSHKHTKYNRQLDDLDKLLLELNSVSKKSCTVLCECLHIEDSIREEYKRMMDIETKLYNKIKKSIYKRIKLLNATK